jgi:hypothetical protein
MLREAEDPERRSSARTAEPSGVRCGACKTLLATQNDVTERAGAVDHVFANPAGVVFSIRCFARVEHVQLVGERTFAATWFCGYAWQIAICEACHLHLGWAFFGEAPFWALVRDRIEES